MGRMERESPRNAIERNATTPRMRREVGVRREIETRCEPPQIFDSFLMTSACHVILAFRLLFDSFIHNSYNSVCSHVSGPVLRSRIWRDMHHVKVFFLTSEKCQLSITMRFKGIPRPSDEACTQAITIGCVIDGIQFESCQLKLLLT